METNLNKYSIELDKELKFNFSRSSGPGGQNVNKVNTKVELRFDIANSQVLNDDDKTTLLTKLQNKVNQEGVLIIVSQATRSQLKNKGESIIKFYELINKTLKLQKKRKYRYVSKGAKKRRLNAKKVQSEKKDRRNYDFKD